MENPAPAAEAVAAAHDMSFVGLFLQADPIVKGVMILLVVASIACWTVVFEKIVRLAAAKRQAKAFEALVRSGGSLDGEQRGISGHIVKAAIDAWRDQDPSETRAERRERIERAMRAALGLEMKRLQNGLALLATSGSTAPFIGLFGTVIGIIKAFRDLALAGTGGPSVVAKGIAEALVATAGGLAVAIPAAVLYNYFQRRVKTMNAEMEVFSTRFVVMLGVK